MVSITSIIGVIALSAAVEGYLKNSMAAWQRIIMAIGAFCLIVPESITDIVGLVLVIAMALLNFKANKAAA